MQLDAKLADPTLRCVFGGNDDPAFRAEEWRRRAPDARRTPITARHQPGAPFETKWSDLSYQVPAGTSSGTHA